MVSYFDFVFSVWTGFFFLFMDFLTFLFIQISIYWELFCIGGNDESKKKMDDRSRKERKKGDLIGDRIWSPMRSGPRSGRGDLL
jgi:hypothetical protein